ncbi:MAG: hypothetical protein ABSG40_16400 [Terriglobales bacterium]|jgi:hypothetical protein
MLEFRADAFNVLNHSAFANPNNTAVDNGPINITSTITNQTFTVDARAFQFSLKYSF